MAGKGDTPRPRHVSCEQYRNNWDSIFGMKKPVNNPAKRKPRRRAN